MIDVDSSAAARVIADRLVSRRRLLHTFFVVITLADIL